MSPTPIQYRLEIRGCDSICFVPIISDDNHKTKATSESVSLTAVNLFNISKNNLNSKTPKS